MWWLLCYSISHPNQLLGQAMASLSLPLTRSLITTSTPSSPSNRIPCPSKLNQAGFTRRFACKASATSSEGTGHDNQQTSKIDRRDMLIGLGGLYGMAGLTAKPICHRGRGWTYCLPEPIDMPQAKGSACGRVRTPKCQMLPANRLISCRRLQVSLSSHNASQTRSTVSRP